MAKYTKAQESMISAKISKVHKDHPEKSRSQMLGMAFGILKHEGMLTKKAKKKKRMLG